MVLPGNLNQQDGQDCFDETADELHKSHDGMKQQCVISVEEGICSKANIAENGYDPTLSLRHQNDC